MSRTAFDSDAEYAANEAAINAADQIGSELQDLTKRAKETEDKLKLAIDQLKKSEFDFNLLGIREDAPMRKNITDLIKKISDEK